MFNISDVYLNNNRASLKTGNRNIFNNTKGFTMTLPKSSNLLIITCIHCRQKTSDQYKDAHLVLSIVRSAGGESSCIALLNENRYEVYSAVLCIGIGPIPVWNAAFALDWIWCLQIWSADKINKHQECDFFSRFLA